MVGVSAAGEARNRRSSLELILIFMICLSVTTHVFQKCNGTRGSGDGGSGRRPGVVHYILLFGSLCNETLLGLGRVVRVPCSIYR